MREIEKEAELLALRWTAGQVNIILDRGIVHFGCRRGDRLYVYFLRRWYRAARRFANFDYLPKSGYLGPLVIAYSRLGKLLEENGLA